MTEIVASGGIVWRQAGSDIEILLIHRDRYRDWSLPKGKLDRGETAQQAALREVEEETGMKCKLGVPVGSMRYGIGNRRMKRVHYWSMEAVDGTFVPNREVDEITWATPAAADRILTYGRDRDLIRHLYGDWWKLTGRLYLVRHALAGSRGNWKGNDMKRPITKRGRRQAQEIGDFLYQSSTETLLTSPYLRCRQTLKPAARRLEIPVSVSEALIEDYKPNELKKLMKKMRGTNSALCSHGNVIHAALDFLKEGGTRFEHKIESAKGSIWVVDVIGKEFAAARYIRPFA